jgi:hypothetical protein
MKKMKCISFVLLSILILNGCALKYVVPEPVISTFSPASGTTGATVTIIGSCFGTSPSVYLNGTSATVTSVLSTNSTYSDKITFLVPAGATTGKIKVSNTGGSTTSAINFVVK